jgi:hypothetical protein
LPQGTEYLFAHEDRESLSNMAMLELPEGMGPPKHAGGLPFVWEVAIAEAR